MSFAQAKSTSLTEFAKPVLKWAGGKRQLLPQLRRFYPTHFGAYYEPFLGSGAVFLDLLGLGRLINKSVCVADLNTDLICFYQAVRDEPEALIRALKSFEKRHREIGTPFYYTLRDEQFNRSRALRNGGTVSNARLAAMFLYLNRTAFNGLFRVNSKGAFNVPAGRYEWPSICDSDAIRLLAAALNTRRIRLVNLNYLRSIRGAKAGDFVYLDPPYAPVTSTANFTAYTSGGFDAVDQERLCALVMKLAARGCHVLLSNSDAATVRGLYQSHVARALGIQVFEVPARRAINSRAAGRGYVTELLVTNIPPNSHGVPVKRRSRRGIIIASPLTAVSGPPAATL
jgi:DNA adenine methylase